MNEHLETFRDRMRMEFGRSPATVKSYICHLKRLMTWLQKRDVREWREVTIDHLQEFLMDEKIRVKLSGEPVGEGNLRATIITIRRFWQSLEDEGIRNIADVLDVPKAWNRLPRDLSKVDVDRLLTPEGETPEQLCDRAVLELAYASGLRLHELCGLRLENLMLADKFLRVVGKGRRERLALFGERARIALEAWLSFGRPRLANRSPGTVFLTNRGTTFAVNTLWRRIKLKAKRAGIANVTPHKLRHSFATHLMENGADIRVVQELLGHASISSTQVYTHVRNPQLSATLKRCHPRHTTATTHDQNDTRSQSGDSGPARASEGP